MEILQSMQKLQLHTPRLIETINSFIRSGNKGLNTLGVIDAAAQTLKALGETPQGRGTWQILWEDKLEKGKSKLFKGQIILIILAILAFIVMFFSILFPEIAALARITPAIGKVRKSEWATLPGACPDHIACVEGLLEVDYVLNNQPIVGTGFAYCNFFWGDPCTCCEQYLVNLTISILYDPQYPSVIYMTRTHDSPVWKSAVLHTVFWPSFTLFIVGISFLTQLTKSWIQSRKEKGLRTVGKVLKDVVKPDYTEMP